MGQHRKLTGILHVVLGALALVPMVLLVAIFAGAWGIVAAASRDPKASAVVGVSLVAVLMIVFVVLGLFAALSMVGGAGVIRGHRWADILVTVLAVLDVFNVPLGTALAVYTVWALWIADPAPVRALPVPERRYQVSP